jgi:hypothetical protein
MTFISTIQLNLTPGLQLRQKLENDQRMMKYTLHSRVTSDCTIIFIKVKNVIT